MIDTRPDNFREEIEAAIRFRKQHTCSADELVKHFAGRAYRETWGDGKAHPENHSYEWVTNIRGTLVSSAPVIRCSAPGYDDDPQVMAHELWINDWIKQVRLVSELRSIAVAQQFTFCPVVVTMEPAQDGSDWFRDQDAAEPPMLRPVVNKIPAKFFFADHLALGPDKWRYAGHIVIQDKADMLTEMGLDGKPKFDRAAIESLQEDEGLNELYAELGLPTDARERKQIVRYEVYCRDDGMLYSLGFGATATGGKAVYLRKPRKFAGPRSGPYVIFGGLEVPDQLYPLAPLAATKDQSDDINAHARQAASDAGTAKRIVVVDGSAGVAGAIRMSESGAVLAIPGFTGTLQTIQFGGAQPETLNYIEVAKDRLDRVSGLTESVRGNITGATAEEVHTAQANRNVRTRDAQTEFRENVLKVIRLAGWQGWHSTRVGATGLREMLPSGEPGDIVDYQGGVDEQSPIPFSAVHYTIEENSMEYVDEFLKQQAMQQTVQLVMEISARIITEPHVRWATLLDDVCETVNITNASAKYLDLEMLEMMRMQQAMMGMGGMGGGGMGMPAGPGLPQGEGAAPAQPAAAGGRVAGRTEAQAGGAKRHGAMARGR